MAALGGSFDVQVLIITVFCSMILVIAGLLLFFKSVKQGDFEHGDRLSLLPLEEDEIAAEPATAAPPAPAHSDFNRREEGKGSLPDDVSKD